MKKFYNYDGTCDKWTHGIVTKKLDGCRVHVNNGIPTSRADKPVSLLLPVTIQDGVYEFFKNDFTTTVSIFRQKELYAVPAEELYRLDIIDQRLVLFEFTTGITPEIIKDALTAEANSGGEGLVIHLKDYLVKVKKTYTIDVKITQLIEGTGKYVGKLGAFVTPMGKVGTGFSDVDRDKYFNNDLVGTTIEVECMEVTAANMFRHPRFIRLRPDKV